MTTVFLDRDGVINRNAKPHEYISSPEKFIMLPGAAEGVALLNKAGFQVFLATNQRGIARGLISVSDLDRIHSYMKALLAKEGAHLDGIYYCPHNENQCDCRKPGTGMLEKAARDFKVDRNHCWMVGDKKSDVLCGKGFGAKTVLIGNENEFGADYLCRNLKSAAELICKLEEKEH